MYPKETKIEKDTCIPLFIAVLFTVARKWKQSRCSSTDEWIKKLIHIYNGILLSHKKKHIWVSSNEMDEPKTYYADWSKSEREKQVLHINAYIWNLEKWYWWTYLQGSNGDADIQTCGHSGEWENGTNGESSMETCTLPYVKLIVRGTLPYDSGSSDQCSHIWEARE